MALEYASGLKQYVQGLSEPVYLLNPEGTDLISGKNGPVVPPALRDAGQTADRDGYHLVRSQIKPGLWWAGSLRAGRSGDFFLLLDQLLASLSAQERDQGPAGAYRRLLIDSLSPAETEALAAAHHLPVRCAKIVYLICTVQDHPGTPVDLLSEVLPLSQGDVLVPVDEKSSVFLREAPRQENGAETLEFAQAMQESLLTETGHGVIVGIGGKARDLSALHACYQQAVRAIAIGRVFCEEQTVFDFGAMLLPRFLAELSPQIAEHYHRLLFNPSTARLFNEEMLRTIRAFFQKDLNLSDTARQLYIHRNTLVYRLDKVQRETGLDLRKFDDAVTFKILMDMQKCKANRIYSPD